MVSREMVKLRRAGRAPYHWLADNSRWVRRPQTYGGVEEMLSSGAHYYRRDLWRENPVAVEIWCEKDALAGVLYEVTAEYAAPLYVVSGFSSLTSRTKPLKLSESAKSQRSFITWATTTQAEYGYRAKLSRGYGSMYPKLKSIS